jgi:hypothetical protein
MFTKTKIALVVVLGIVGAASAALANDIDESASAAQAAREMHGNPLPWWWNSSVQGRGSFAQGGTAYGYVASPAQQQVPSRKKSHNH